jgi:nucleotide-binding universal stress UspA family protein
MNPSSIMVRLTTGTSNDAVLKIATDLAQRVKATRLIGISACQPLQIYATPDAYIPSELASWDLEHIEKDLSAAEAAFRNALEGKVANCQWRSNNLTYGTIADYVAEQMRAADLLLTAADKDASVFDRNHVDLADLVIRAGRPVLVVGTTVDKLDLRSVLVGWKDTREARRATQDALPILKLADRVTVVEVAAKRDLDNARKRTEDVAAWLAGHGISAVARAAVATGDDSVEIENIAKELDAGLLVGGAYGHNRFREWVLGGVTKDLLMHPARCSFMSH